MPRPEVVTQFDFAKIEEIPRVAAANIQVSRVAQI